MRWVVAIACMTACYSPQPAPGAPCPDGVCPTGLVCSGATRTCELTAVDARTGDDARTPDARLADAYMPTTPVMRQDVVSYANAAASLSATLPSSPATGSLLVMIGGTPAGPLTSVTGGGVTTWKLADKSTVQSNVEIWYGITNGSSPTVTIARTSNNAPTWLSVSEWSGLRAAVDASTVLDGGTTTASAGTLTTTTRDLLVFGLSQFPPTTIGTPTPGTWTALMPIDGMLVKQRAWYRIEETPGDYTPSVSVSNSPWDAVLVAFEIAP